MRYWWEQKKPLTYGVSVIEDFLLPFLVLCKNPKTLTVTLTINKIYNRCFYSLYNYRDIPLGNNVQTHK